MGTIEIDGKKVEIERMFARKDYLYRNNAQVEVSLKYPRDVETFIEAVNNGRVEFVARRTERTK